MTLRQYLVFMSFATLLAWIAFFSVFFFLDPTSGNLFALIMFYTSLFLALVGTIAILGFFARVRMREDAVIAREVTSAFRQGCFLSFIFTSALYLQSKDLLVWWNILLLIGAVTILEFLFVSYRRNR